MRRLADEINGSANRDDDQSQHPQQMRPALCKFWKPSNDVGFRNSAVLIVNDGRFRRSVASLIQNLFLNGGDGRSDSEVAGAFTGQHAAKVDQLLAQVREPFP